jgi:hypothetical protein
LDTTIHKQTEITGKCSDTISNEELHGRAETTKAMEVIIQTRWSWISHALRMDKSRIGTTALKWQSEGSAQTTKNNMEKDGRDRKRHTRDFFLSCSIVFQVSLPEVMTDITRLLKSLIFVFIENIEELKHFLA